MHGCARIYRAARRRDLSSVVYLDLSRRDADVRAQLRCSVHLDVVETIVLELWSALRPSSLGAAVQVRDHDVVLISGLQICQVVSRGQVGVTPPQAARLAQD